MLPTHALRHSQLKPSIASGLILLNSHFSPLSATSCRSNSSVASPRSSTSRPSANTTTTTTTATPKLDSNGLKKAKPHKIDSRWLTLIKRRIGKCLMFGLKPAQVDQAGRVLQRLAENWREYIAASEGFLTHTTRRSLFRRDVVWGDMDSMVSHINNVAYVRYAETARVNLVHNYAMHIDPAHRTEWLDTVGNKGIGLILQSIKIDYKFPMTWPDKITVYHRLTQNPAETLPKSFFQQELIILSEAKQRPAARVLEQNFLFDYNKLGKTDTPPKFILDQFSRTWKLQEENKKQWQRRIADVEDEVRRLEMESWDNPNAVEDMGSAGR